MGLEQLMQEESSIGNLDGALVKRISVFAQKQLQLEKRIEIMEEQVKTAKKQLEQISMIDIPEAMEEAGVHLIELSSGEKVEVKTIFTASIKEANKAQAFTWLQKHKLGSIIKSSFILEYGKGEADKAAEAKRVLQEHSLLYKEKEGVHPQTLKKTVRELLEDGGLKVPLDLFGVHEFHKTTITS